MRSANERRQELIEELCRVRKDTVANLAEHFGVSERTIRYDLEVLTAAHPIETFKGRYGGGVKVLDGYYVGRKYLKPSQYDVLVKLQGQLTGTDLEAVNSIIRDFAIGR